MTQETAPSAKKEPNKLLLEYAPLIAFFAAFQYFKRSHPDEAMVWAAGILAILATITLTYSWLKYKYLSPILILTSALVVFFASLTFFTGDKTFLFMKPTIVNTFFGIGIVAGVFFKKNVIKMMMGDAFELPDIKWNTLAIRWGGFFFVMAILNEIVWRNFSENFWVNYKVFGGLSLTLLFTLTQIPYILKHGSMKQG